MQQKEEFTKIRKILKWVWENRYSSFYRDKYKKAGFSSLRDIKTLADFEKLPFLTRDELVTDPFKRVFLPQSKAQSVFVSSGTTDSNQPLLLFKQLMHYKEPNPTLLILYKLMKNLQIRRVLFMSPPTFVNFIIKNSPIYTRFNSCHIFGDITNLQLSAIIAAKTKIQAIESNATILEFFIPYLKKVYDLKEIKLIRLVGEFCSESRLNFLKHNFPKAKFNCYFASAETSSIGYQCEFLGDDPNIFHLTPYLPEVIDSVSEKLRPKKEEGELVLTSLFKDIMPLIRYRTGTMVIFLDRFCKCGSPSMLFQLKGRANFDSVKIQGVTIHTQSIEKALETAKDYVERDYKIHIYEKIRNNRVVIHCIFELIKKDSTGDEEKLKIILMDIICRNLYLSARMTLADLVSKNAFTKPEIKFVSQLPFEAKRKHIVLHLV